MPSKTCMEFDGRVTRGCPVIPRLISESFCSCPYSLKPRFACSLSPKNFKSTTGARSLNFSRAFFRYACNWFFLLVKASFRVAECRLSILGGKVGGCRLPAKKYGTSWSWRSTKLLYLLKTSQLPCYGRSVVELVLSSYKIGPSWYLTLI